MQNYYYSSGNKKGGEGCREGTWWIAYEFCYNPGSNFISLTDKQIINSRQI